MPTKNPPGRPSGYSAELADEICARMNEGRSLKSICEDADMPTQKMVFRWLAKNETFRQKYRACAEIRADALHEIMQSTALTPLNGDIVTLKKTKDGTFIEKRTGDNVERSKLIVHTLMWQIARMAPKKYGDKQSVELAGKDGGDIGVSVRGEATNAVRSVVSALTKGRATSGSGADEVDKPRSGGSDRPAGT
jgi:hypothetical protein